jgi:prolipoprotein diacylglyceryltransferase
MWQVIWRIPIKTGWTPDGIPFCAFLLCTWLAGKRGEREGIRKETIQDMAIWIFLGGLLGARLAYLLQQRPLPPIGELIAALPKIWDGGIILYGSVIGGVASFFLAYLLVFRRKGLSPLRFCDTVAPTVALGLALGRMGCLLNGCCYGQVACADCAVVPIHFPMSAPSREFLVDQGYQTAAGFTVVFPPDEKVKGGVQVGLVDPASPAYLAGLRPGSVIVAVNDEPTPTAQALSARLSLASWPRGESRLKLEFQQRPGDEPLTATIHPRSLGLYPTQLYEVISMLLLFVLLLAYEPFRTNPGQLTALLMIGYGLHRSLNEVLRDDPRPIGFERYGSIILVAAGAALWLWLWRKQSAAPAQPIAAGTATPVSSPA